MDDWEQKIIKAEQTENRAAVPLPGLQGTKPPLSGRTYWDGVWEVLFDDENNET